MLLVTDQKGGSGKRQNNDLRVLNYGSLKTAFTNSVVIFTEIEELNIHPRMYIRLF